MGVGGGGLFERMFRGWALLSRGWWGERDRAGEGFADGVVGAGTAIGRGKDSAEWLPSVRFLSAPSFPRPIARWDQREVWLERIVGLGTRWGWKDLLFGGGEVWAR